MTEMYKNDLVDKSEIKDVLKVVIFYGGDVATTPRDDLLNWLRTPQTSIIVGKKIEARKVADETANSGHTVDQRVEQAIEWADKAIMLFTPDTRSAYGAPNLLEEFGRWRSKKGGETMIVIRHQDVEKIHTNAAGLIYISYKDDVVSECSEKLLLFLHEAIIPKQRDRFTQQRCTDLNDNIQDTLSLMTEYEAKRRYSSDPKEKRRVERDIADLRDELSNYETEARKLGC